MALQFPNDQSERFSVYGFSIHYPSICRVEFNPKSSRGRGDLVFHFPDREKLFITWGNLSAAQKTFHTLENQVEYSMKSIKKSSNIKNLTRSTDSMEVNSHRAAYNYLQLEELGRGLISRAKIPRSAYSVHLHCPNSERFFAIYSPLTPMAPHDFGDLFKAMVLTFKCH
jgi:hypothetical protein